MHFQDTIISLTFNARRYVAEYSDYAGYNTECHSESIKATQNNIERPSESHDNRHKFHDNHPNSIATATNSTATDPNFTATARTPRQPPELHSNRHKLYSNHLEFHSNRPRNNSIAPSPVKHPFKHPTL